MISERLASTVLCLAAAAILGGCATTRFESRPAGEFSACDRRWIGTWRIDLPDEEIDDAYIVVSDGCTTMTFHMKGEPPESIDPAELEFGQVGTMSILVSHPSAPDVTTDKADHDEWAQAVQLYRYAVRGDRIRVSIVDHEHVAHALIDGRLRGHTEYTSQRANGRRLPHGRKLDNVVAGTPEQIADVLRKDSRLFNRWLTLRRATAVPDGYDRPSADTPENEP